MSPGTTRARRRHHQPLTYQPLDKLGGSTGRRHLDLWHHSAGQLLCAGRSSL